MDRNSCCLTKRARRCFKHLNAEPDHWSERGRITSVGDANAPGRPRRSVPLFGHIAMKHPVTLDVTCEDFLKDNRHVYALKARRKKIALICVEAVNKHSADIHILLGDSILIAGDQTYKVETPSVIIRKFSEFTWDFLLYAILVFQPVLLAVDIFFFLSGPLYNRRLRKQLHSLSDGEMLLKPGECKKALIGFRGVSKGAGQLQLWYCCQDGEKQQARCAIL